MVQAAASGVIDFSKVDPFNTASRLRTSLLLQETDRRIAEKQAFTSFLRAVALTATSTNTIVDATHASHAELLTTCFKELVNLHFPQLIEKETDETILQKAVREWEETFNTKIDGPEVKAMAEKMAAMNTAAHEKWLKQQEDELWLANYKRAQP